MAEPLPKLDIAFTEGDTLPPLTGSLKGTDLSTGAVTLRITQPDGTVVELDAEPVDGGTDGRFAFEWGADDLVAGKGQECLLRYEDEDGALMTLLRFTIDVDVEPALEEA
jgi:hypothetical protein